MTTCLLSSSRRLILIFFVQNARLRQFPLQRFAVFEAAAQEFRPGRHGDVRVDALQVKGQPLPDEVLSQLRLHNLAQDLAKNQSLSRTLGQLQSIEVADGAVTIKAAGSE